MNIRIEKVLERDIDLLIINKIIDNDKLLNLFLNKINKSEYKIVSIEHSQIDKELGETDISIILTNNKSKIAILIENKIDAPFMNEQPIRYYKRGNKGISDGLYDEYYVFIIAPREYLNTHNEVKEYDNQISYEEIREVLDDLYSKTLIEKAIEEKKSGYIVIENERATKFWENYYKYIKDNYPTIKINEIYGPKSDINNYSEFETFNPNVKIKYKFDKGYLELTFSKMGEYPNTFHKYVDNLLNKDMIIEKINKYMVIRLQVPIISFNTEFIDYEKEVKEALDKSLMLYNLLNKIDINSMYNEIKLNHYDIKDISDFRKLYQNGIIVNYDKRIVYRSSTNHTERIGNTVDYPYIQRYQSGINVRTKLFIIKDNMLFQLERIDKNNENSKYKIIDVNINIAESFYNDSIFNEKGNNPVNITKEELLQIEENI